jgi:hypothetical protein
MTAALLIWMAVLMGPMGAAPAAGALATEPGLLPRRVVSKATLPAARAEFDRLDRLVVKFHEGTLIRLRGARLTSLDGSADLSSVDGWLTAHPGVQVVRHFSRSEEELDIVRASGQRESGWELADLNLYFEFRLPTGAQSAAALTSMLAELRALPVVECAFAEPIPQPARAVARTQERAKLDASRPIPSPQGVPPQTPPAPATPDFTGMQGYLGPSPSGVNAQAVWGFPGGRGALVRIIDIEGAWLWNHEDLKPPFFTGGTPINDAGWRNHGTAVMGEMAGRPNGTGVTGIASDLAIGGISIGDVGVADAIDMAAANESIGDLFLIELHAPGPNANGVGQHGYVAMEFWQDNFDAIQTAVANGRICIEAAGNGEENYDDPIYQGLFDRTVRNSGAIIVGAGTPTGLDAEWFSNYGSRLDLNGWGDSVTTTGYGDLQGGAETQWYTAAFNGTSSASPIVSGSVASLQGMSKALWGIPLSGPLAAQILFDTGTPWVGARRIGNRPNLVAARAMLLQGIGTVSGTVRDAVTNLPIPGAKILLVERNILTLTDGTGAYRIPLRSGTYTLRVSDFFHLTTEQVVTVGAGQQEVVDFSLSPAPSNDVAGNVFDDSGAPLAGVTVRILDTPLPTTQTDASGAYRIPGIPVGGGYLALFGLLPTYGAAWKSFAVQANQGAIANATLFNAETFEAGGGGYTGDALWQWGTPSGVGPDGAFSGTRCWGTNLTGNYPDNAAATLTSPILDPTGYPLVLSFTHYYDTESGFDGGNVQVNTGSGWVTITPIGGYPSKFLSGLGNEDGWSGNSGGWQPVAFDLSAYAQSHLTIRFRFGSDGGVNGPGWYIDDVAIYLMGPGAAGAEETASTEPSIRLLPARPNPFRDASLIGFRLPVAAASARLRIIDAAGRSVMSLLEGPAAAGERIVRWNGKDVGGRAVPAGVYFYALDVDGKTIATRPIVRIR